ncbi:Ada metal-binding domain-containing protein [Brevibacillus laterosporus]|uniref:Ada metal-binding domain-containing protein n=1 Tax=Brevibacillus laterosporus TaxID=1465 RepID=UPI0018CCA94B|nr:Ada metal-binding domain-containing protein [Brevibacillus laterosporus]MED1912654.1 Ada metal-binding domain-containing protein [Brevibacillus laterosporus]
MEKRAGYPEWDASYFTGKKTEKIYCFPWCTELLDLENTIRFETRANAEQAGYRSCKTCCSTLPVGAWEDQQKELTLVVPKEFSFTENMKYLSKEPNECLFYSKNQRIYRAIPIEEETPVVEIRAGQDNMIHIRFLGDTMPSSKWVRAEVARYVRDWFDLDTDLLPFYDLARTDVLLQRAVTEFTGLRNIGIPDLFEAICWGIIGQQINLPFAYTLKRRMVESFGRSVECNGEKYWIFPTPHDISALSVEDLNGLRMTVKKCEYLIGVAQLMVEGKLTKEQLWNCGDYKKAENMLVKIRGIGPWTANYVLMRCLKIPSAFPIDDVGLHNAIKYLQGTPQKPTKEEILKLSATWTNWEAYATFYLWRFLY